VVTHLYAGQHSEAAKGLRQETLEAPTREARCRLAARSYLALPRGEQAQTLLLASTNEERRLVTAEVRAGLAASGRLGSEATVTTLRALEFADVHKRQAANILPGYVVKFQGDLPRWARRGEAYEVASINVRENTVRLRDANQKERIVPCESLARATLYRKEQLSLAKGDRVVWTQNDRRLGVLNNDTFEVSKVSKTGVTLKSATGVRNGRLTLSTDGLHHLDHAWALTVYRSQGQTSKNVILVADEGMSARELLVGVTRATQGVLIVAHDREDIEKLAAKKDGKHIAHEVAVVVPSTQVPRQAMRDEKERTQERGGWDVASF
jgi:UvrD-like helicase C-terminal domain